MLVEQRMGGRERTFEIGSLDALDILGRLGLLRGVLLTALGIDNEYDYARRGAGGEKAMIRDVCQRVEDGYQHWRMVDIKEFFASIRPGHFGWLPVPKKLIRNVVFLPKCARVKIVMSDGGLELMKLAAQCASPKGTTPSYVMAMSAVITREVRRELPQGSVLSPLVARAFVGREIRAVLGNDEVARFSFVDDLALSARSQPQVEDSLDDLRARLLGNPAGPISLHVDPPSTKRGRICVFGYVLKPRLGYGDNFVHVYPGKERFHPFYRKLWDAWKSAGCPADWDPLILERLKYWMPSQQAWTLIPVHSKDVAHSGANDYMCEEYMKEWKALAIHGQ